MSSLVINCNFFFGHATTVCAINKGLTGLTDESESCVHFYYYYTFYRKLKRLLMNAINIHVLDLGLAIGT